MENILTSFKIVVIMPQVLPIPKGIQDCYLNRSRRITLMTRGKHRDIYVINVLIFFKYEMENSFR